MVERGEWQPPELPGLSASGELRGVLYGSRLFDQPRHRAVRERVEAFLAGEAPSALEIGFDHGMRILDLARRRPGWRWLGAEIRQARVDAAAPHAPPNCLLLRADGRALLAGAIPAGSLDLCTILFPTPATDGSHLLITPALAALLARALRPGGQVHIETDVPAMAAWAERCFTGWPDAGAGAPEGEGAALSRRQRVCRRDGLPTWTVRRCAPL